MHILKNRDFLRYYFKLTLPVMIQQLLVNLVSMCDTLMISSVGEDAISAVAVANKFFFIYSLAIFGLTNGVGLYISQYYGANDQTSYNRVFRYGNVLCIIVGALVSVFLFVNPEITISIFVKNPRVIAMGVEYVEVLRWCYIPFAIAGMCSVAFRVMGHPQIPMISGLVAFITNVVLNYLLIMGNFGFPQLGVAGAAIATCISRWVEMILLLVIVNRKDSRIRMHVAYGKLSFSLKKDIIAKAIPLMCNEVMYSLGLSIVFLNFSFMSESSIPALTVVDNINNLVYVLFSGCGVAIGVMVGSELGANRIDKAKENAKNMIWMALLTYAIGSALILITSGITPKAFSLRADSLHLATLLLIVKSLLSWTQGYSNTIYYILRSGGDTKSVLIIDGLFTWLGPVLTSTIFSRIFPIDFLFLYIAVEAMGLVKVCIATMFYRKEKWIRNLTQHA